MATIVNGIKAIKTENLSISPDDRQELVQLVNGATVIDGWGGTRQAVGDVTALTLTFDTVNANKIIGYWNNRTLVPVTLEDGSTIARARIVIRRLSYPKMMQSKYVIVDIEFWRC